MFNTSHVYFAFVAIVAELTTLLEAGHAYCVATRALHYKLIFSVVADSAFSRRLFRRVVNASLEAMQSLYE